MSGAFVIFIILMMVGVIFYSIMQSKQADEAWAAVAEELGVRYSAGKLFSSRRISGQVEDLFLEIDTYQRRSGKHSVTYTRFRVTFPSVGLGLKLTRQGFFSGVAKMFGSQDIEVGEGGFDDAVVVKGTDETRVKQFLTQSRRFRIQRFLDSHGEAEITDSSIKWSTRGLITNQYRLTKTAMRMLTLANHLIHDDPDDDALEVAITAQAEGRFNDALDALENLPEQENGLLHNRADERMLQGDLYHLGGRDEEARRAFQAAASEDPEDEDLQYWSAETPPEPNDTETSDFAEAAVNESSLSAANVCQSLFETQDLSYHINRRFEDHYAGKTVRWSGTLQRAEAYSYDFVFGDEPGVKAEITVYELATGLDQGRPISAMVQFPVDTLEKLQDREGQQILFEADLQKVDPLMRHLFMVKGRLH